MRIHKFRPEIRRNRILSNWVRSRETLTSPTSMPKRPSGIDSWHVKYLIGILALVGVLALWGYWGSSSSEVAKPAVQPMKSKYYSVSKVESDPCSLDEITGLASARRYSRLEIPDLDGYKREASQGFGGLLAVEYKCNGPDADVPYRVQWQLIDNSWEVKRISRLLDK